MIGHDAGNGPALYAGGLFDFAGDANSEAISRWNGVRWDFLDGGMGTGGSLSGALGVFALKSTGENGKPVLYLGGNFGSGAGVLSRNIARWAVPEGCP